MDNAKKVAIFGVSFILLVFGGAISHYYFLIIIGMISLITSIYFAFETNKDLTNTTNIMFDKILKKNNIHSDKKYISKNWLNGIAIDEHKAKVILCSRNTVKDNFTIEILNFNQIIEAKIISNQETLISTSLPSTITRSAIGGILFGGIGSILGGATATKTATKGITELTLEIVVDNLLNPRYTFSFYKGNKTLNNNDYIINEIENWYRSLTVIIKRNKHEVRSV